MFSYLDVIHRYTYKKNQRFRKQKIRNLCFESSQKYGDLFFVEGEGRLARVNKNKYVFFWGGAGGESVFLWVENAV